MKNFKTNLKYAAPIVIIGGIYLATQTGTQMVSRRQTAEPGLAKTSREVASVAPASEVQGKADVNSAAATIAVSPQVVPTATIKAQHRLEKVILTRQEVGILKEYKKIKNKVFLTDKDKKNKNEFLSNETLLNRMKDYLLQQQVVKIGSEEMLHEFLAIDLLLDASVELNSQVAKANLIEIIQDQQVEDKAVSQDIRESMAGIKAEILYNWTALQPDETNNIVKAVGQGGPVTVKIWEQAQDLQEQNRLASIEAR